MPTQQKQIGSAAARRFVLVFDDGDNATGLSLLAL